MSEGGTDLVAICSRLSPAHFISNLRRYARRYSIRFERSVTWSPASLSRGSSLGSTHMSGRTVAAVHIFGASSGIGSDISLFSAIQRPIPT